MNSVQPTRPGALAPSQGNPLTGQASPGRDDFLNLLVTQLRHQDPLNPMEGSDFAAQLAQFSSVEELRGINERLENNLQADMMMAQSVNNTMAATLIGKEVHAVNDRILNDGQAGNTIAFNLDAPAASVTVEILDASGRIVKSVSDSNLAAGLNRVEWNGRDAQGAQVPAGEYRVKITYTGRGGDTGQALPLAIGRVEAVKFVDGNPVLVVGGRDIAFGTVVQILAAGQEQSPGWIRRLLEQ